jgi:hypothetical protein
MIPNDLVPGNADAWLISELALMIVSALFIWRIAIIREKTPLAILALGLFALGFVASLWAMVINIAER